MMIIEMIKAVLFGIVEGITEWLPVSSTTHIRLLNLFVQMRASEAFMQMFEVVIQLGAILAVVLLYLPRLWPFKRPSSEGWPLSFLRPSVWQLWGTILVAVLPSALIGIPLDDWIDAHLERWPVICVVLIVYGIAFLVLDKQRAVRIRRAEEIDLKTAFLIGLCQALSLIPGTSRSGATILGATLLGCSRTAAVEFSFFMAIPTMAGASLLKLLKLGGGLRIEEALILLIACATAFVVSLTCIRALIGYIKKHSFAAFGWYRIILALVIGIILAAQRLMA